MREVIDYPDYTYNKMLFCRKVFFEILSNNQFRIIKNHVVDPAKATKKCIKEEVHKDVVVTGEFSITETPGHIVSSFIIRAWTVGKKEPLIFLEI